MSIDEQIKKVLKKNSGIITVKDALDNNIPRTYLTEYSRSGLLTRIDRGIYIAEDGVIDDAYFFQYKNKQCVFSHQYALYLHGLSDRIPFQLEVTVYKGYNRHRIDRDVIVHYVSKKVHPLFVTTVKTNFSNVIKVYDKERTLCDITIHRKNTDPEIFAKAYQNYMRDEDKDISKLINCARIMKIETEVKNLIEILL